MGLTTYNLNEKRWAISLTYFMYVCVHIQKKNVSHNHRLERNIRGGQWVI